MTWFSNQLEGLGDDLTRLCDSFNTDLSSGNVSHVPHSGCKAGDNDGPLAGCNHVEVKLECYINI